MSKNIRVYTGKDPEVAKENLSAFQVVHSIGTEKTVRSKQRKYNKIHIGFSTFTVKPSITQPGKFILIESWMGF